MRVAIIGAGFTGLTTALRLSQKGIKVWVFESEDYIGGLSRGFKKPNWNWSLEHFYHHIFANDKAIIKLAREINYSSIFFRPTTAVFFNNNIYPFDNAIHLMKFPHLSFISKLRMGTAIGILKINPFWKILESSSASQLLNIFMGKSGYETIWKPLIEAKFGPYANQINTAWFWARIKKRTAKLGYFKFGFQGLAKRMNDLIIQSGGRIYLNSSIEQVEKKKNHFQIKLKNKSLNFDKVVVTSNTQQFLNITKDLPQSYINKLRKLKSIDAFNLILITKKPLMKNIYWLNITDTNFPFVVIAEHTNMISSKNYGGNHIIYLGAYLKSKHKYFSLSKKQLLKLAIKQINKINTNFKKEDIIDTFVFRGINAQPIITKNYSKIRPKINTPIKGLQLGNLHTVYPWDRGCNYAVELGEKLADKILKDD